MAKKSKTAEGNADDSRVKPVSHLFADHFKQYASYVILDRAIPDIRDGLKPVQRRILYTLIEIDDGRFHKVANVIGHTMRYHPHGDASIGDALVNLANKDYFIDRQGNFGNVLTGDAASAARYIECRLSALGREVLFQREMTDMVSSYDGRNLEPVVFPCKIPYLLLQGAEGIAVGMATKILPHNFVETLKAQIEVLQGRKTRLLPDFIQGGVMDVTEYDDGEGRVKIRARIDKHQRSLIIRELPYGVTTESLTASIEEAIRRNRVKAVSLKDFTTENVELEVALQRGADPDEVLKRLFAYTDCEVALTSNTILIHEKLPRKMKISEILKVATDGLLALLKRELELKIRQLREQLHHKTLEQIFIENRMYHKIENSESYEAARQTILKLLKPFAKKLPREISDEDIEKLLGIPIRRITRFDVAKNQEEIRSILEKIDAEEKNLGALKKYAVNFLKHLIQKYGDQYPRHTRIQNFELVSAKDLKDKDCRVFYDMNSGYIGTKVREGAKLDCSSFDKLLLISREGKYRVVPVPEKLFCGKLVHFGVLDRNQVFNVVSSDPKSGHCYVKRFRVEKFIQNKEYAYLDGGHKLEDFTARTGVRLHARYMIRVKDAPNEADFEFNAFPIKTGNRRGIKLVSRKILKLELIYPAVEREAEESPPANNGD